MPAEKKLVIYHTSDVHDRRGFGIILRRIVEADSLLVDCGDSLRGSSTVFLRREPVMLEFAAAPYRAQAVGNREFHYLHRCMIARARAVGVPWVCSNVIDLRGREPAFSRDLRLVCGQVSVRVLSVLVPQYRTGSGWERLFGWRFLAPEAALDELLARTTPTADATVLLSHAGLSADREIAARFPSLAAIVGGHSHDTLDKPVFVNGVPIVHSGPFAQNAGRLELEMDGVRPQVASYQLVPLLKLRPGAAP